MNRSITPFAIATLAGAALIALSGPALAGGKRHYDHYKAADPYGYVPPVTTPYTHVHRHGGAVVLSHSVTPYAYMHSRVIAQPETVYQPVTRAYTVPVQSYANVETVRTVPVTAYQTVRERRIVPVVSYQAVDSYRQVPVQGYQQVRSIQQVPVTSYATVNRTEYQPTTVYRTHQQNWCCSLAD